MADGSGIQWTEATWNPVTGCTRVSAGCDNCYAVKESFRLERMGQARYAGLTVLNPRGKRHFNGTVRCHEDALEKPLRWRKPRRVFVNSMSDLFHPGVPFEFIDKVFAVMALCPQHTFQVLTKRPERMAEYLGGGTRRTNFHVYNAAATMIDGDWSRMPGDMASTRSSGGTWWPLPNVWLGTSCENQAAANERIPHLVRCPAAVRFLSCEPLLGWIDLTQITLVDSPDGDVTLHPLDGVVTRDGAGIAEEFRVRKTAGIGWVIVGGESGPDARPCDVEWIRSVVKQCRSAGVACFVKQLGARPWAPVENHLQDGNPCGCGACDGCGNETMMLADRKGGDPSEWPEDMRVREFPRLPEAGATGNGADGAEPMEDPEEVHELAPQGVKAFIDEELRWGPGLEVAADRLRDCFHAHRSRYGLSAMSYTKFLRELRRIVPGVSTTSRRGFSGRSRRIYNGVCLSWDHPERKGARRG